MYELNYVITDDYGEECIDSYYLFDTLEAGLHGLEVIVNHYRKMSEEDEEGFEVDEIHKWDGQKASCGCYDNYRNYDFTLSKATIMGMDFSFD